jgi:hypothetical protein
MLQSLLSDVRHEFQSFDPLAIEPATIAALTIDEPPKPRPAHRVKDRRAPTRDYSDVFQIYIGEQLGAHEYRSADDRWRVKDEVLLDYVNTLNVRMDWLYHAWTRWRRGERSPKGAQDLLADQFATLRRLKPLRHLIAIAARPHAVASGELETALEALGAVLPDEVKLATPDIALMLDIAAELRRLSRDVLERLFAHYEQRIDEQSWIKTLLIYWHRDFTNTPGISPQGLVSRRNAEVPS